jgi:hypothetical protein
MRTMIGGALMLWAGMTATTAHAAVDATTCLTDAEAQSVFLAIAPSTIRAVAEKCAPSLPATATLKAGLAPFVAPYETASVSAWPLAMPAIGKMAGPDLKGIDPAAMKPMIGPMIGAMAADKLQPKGCLTIEHAATLMAPLAPANVAGLVVLALGATAKSDKFPIAICSAPVTLPNPK